MSFSGAHLENNSKRRNRALWGLAAALLIIGAGIRLYDLTDPTFQTRQLHGAVLARGMYYQMKPDADPRLSELAISFWKSTTQYEPPILERLAALTYLAIDREYEWVGRLYSSIFWVAGGLGLFALAMRMGKEGSEGLAFAFACLAGLGFYLFSPFAVESSRDFQSDPGMVMWTIFALYALVRWSETRAWQFAILGGSLAGIAILVKVTAAFILLPAAIALGAHEQGLKRLARGRQFWAASFLMALPTLIYIASNPVQGDAVTYFRNTTLALSQLLVQPTFYVGWLNFLQGLISFPTLLLGFIGVILSPPRYRSLLVMIWIGYGLYGIAFPHQIATHDYYHLRLIPVVSLSMVPVLSRIFQPIDLSKRFNLVFLGLIAALATAFPLWVSYTNFSRIDNREAAVRWQEIGRGLPVDGKIVAVTQEYGFPLMFYGWKKVSIWPSVSEQQLKAARGNPKKFEQLFKVHTEGKDYFLVTDFQQLNRQPELRERLFESYPLIIDEEDFMLFDLIP